MRLSGRIALITGGSSGIGAAIALAFAAEGCDVAIIHLGDEGQAETIVERIAATGRRGAQYNCDVSDSEAMAKTISAASAAFGPIDVLVTSAGTSADTPFDAIDPTEWDRMIAVHLRGTFLAVRGCYPTMRSRRWGRIITIASQQALKGSQNKAHYCAAKAGIIGFTKALALEGAPHGVLVNCIAPGPVETPLLQGLPKSWRARKLRELPLGRFGRAEEIAPTAVMLASDDGGFYVGQTLSPNGGDVMAP